MTPQGLRDFVHIRAEMERIGAEIEDMERDLDTLSRVQDTVMASSREWPYILHTVSVQGLGEAAGKDVRALKKRIEAEKAKRVALRADYCAAYDATEAFFDSLGDAELRRMFEYRYVERLTWAAVAGRMNADARLHGVYTEDSCRKRCKRYWDAE